MTGPVVREAPSDSRDSVARPGRSPVTLARRIAPDGWLRGIGWPMGLALIVAGVLSLLGALGSGVLPLGPRTLYWIEVMEAGTLVALTVRPVVCWTGWFAARAWAEAVGVAVIITAVGAPVIWLISAAQFGQAAIGGGPDAFIAPVALLSLVTTSLNYLLQRPARMTHAPARSAADAGPAPARPRLEARLPAHLRGAALIAVSAEDHYLRVRTDRGDALILMRLADALAELEGVEGARTHRSWWVARAAIRDARRGEGRGTLTLAGGIEAPVSRTYARSLRDAGWFG